MCKLIDPKDINLKLLKPDIFNRMVILNQTKADIEKALAGIKLSERKRKELENFIIAIGEWKERRDDRRRC